MRKTSLEDLKKRRHGYDVWHDIERYAVTGYETITPEDLELFKWHGIYEHRPRRGYFMVRVRVPGGQLSSEQARCLAQAGRELARGRMDLTTRQDIQFHWVRIGDIPELVRRLHDVGLSTTSACGDVPRNIVACPLAGRHPDELIDVRPLVRSLNRRLEGNRLYANLPRKLKISICGCGSQCTSPQLHDLSFVAVEGERDADGRRGFELLVGGGLSSRPQLAFSMNVFIPEQEVVEVCEAVCRLFGEHGNRQPRQRLACQALSRRAMPRARSRSREWPFDTPSIALRPRTRRLGKSAARRSELYPDSGHGWTHLSGGPIRRCQRGRGQRLGVALFDNHAEPACARRPQ